MRQLNVQTNQETPFENPDSARGARESGSQNNFSLCTPQQDERFGRRSMSRFIESRDICEPRMSHISLT
jgi:hypothetical protein